MSKSHLAPDDVADLRSLRPSARLVYIVLEIDGELDQGELVDRTFLSSRSVRRAVDDLEDEGLIEERVSAEDARRRLYRLVGS